jgi:carbamoyl-phosphate synthase large subunit
MGYTFYATKGTAEFMKTNGIDAETLSWPLDKTEPNTLTYLADGKIDLVINIPKNIEKEELENDYLIRRKAVDFNIPLITNVQLAKRFVEALSRTSLEDLTIKSWNEYH